MFIFVHGEDGFRVQEKVSQLRRVFIKKHDPTGMNTSEFPESGSNKLDKGEVLQAASSMAFMGGRRLIVVRGLLENTNAKESGPWIQGLERVPAENIVIFWDNISSKKGKKHKIFKTLKEQGDVHVYAFDSMSGSEVNQWVVNRIEEKQHTITNSALRDLIQRVGTNLWQLSQDIDKLVNYADGQKITKEMVADLVRPSFDGQIFALMDAVSKQEPKKALRLLDEERKAGANDFHLIGMLARQVRILLGAKSMLETDKGVSNKDVAKRLDLHPYVAKKALAQARNVGFDDLKAVHDLLYEFDLGTKTGLLSADMAVDLTTADLLR